jgi:hypothetical protein
LKASEKGVKLRTQYRVVWQRGDNRPKKRGVASVAEAERWIGLLTSDEPWRFLKRHMGEYWKGPDDVRCCDGHECSCNGETVREFCARSREGLPPVAWTRIESRQVTPYTPHKT